MAPWAKIKSLFAGSNAPDLQQKRKSEERRRVKRRQQRLVEGFLWSDRMAFSKACNIRNVSVSGARVELSTDPAKANMLRGLLTLYFKADKQEIDCEVIWRAGSSIGVQFVGPYRAPTRRYGG